MKDALKAKKNRPSSAKVSNMEEVNNLPTKKQGVENLNPTNNNNPLNETVKLSAEGLISPTISARVFRKRFSNDVNSQKLRQISGARNPTMLIKVERVEKSEEIDSGSNIGNSNSNLFVKNNDRARSTSRRSTAMKKMEELMMFEEKFSIADEVSKRSKSRSKTRPNSSGPNAQNKELSDNSLKDQQSKKNN